VSNQADVKGMRHEDRSRGPRDIGGDNTTRLSSSRIHPNAYRWLPERRSRHRRER
jgi:hypothetical protein